MIPSKSNIELKGIKCGEINVNVINRRLNNNMSHITLHVRIPKRYVI